MYLTPLLGSENAERILSYIVAKGSGYPRAIAEFFDVPPQSIGQQLRKMERDGLLVRQDIGKTALYELNQRYALTEAIRELILKTISLYPEEERERLLNQRRRPRRTGKPL